MTAPSNLTYGHELDQAMRASAILEELLVARVVHLSLATGTPDRVRTGFLVVKDAQLAYSSDAEQAYATYLLWRLATEPGIVGAMRGRGYLVRLLSEVDPNNSAVCEPVLGCNLNRGEEIRLQLRSLRSQSNGRFANFYPFEKIRTTLFHELAHNEIIDHNDAFYELMRQLAEEADRVDLEMRGRMDPFLDAVAMVRARNQPATTLACLSALFVLVKNAVFTPSSEVKYRRVPARSQRLRETVLDVPGGRACLAAIGFEPVRDEFILHDDQDLLLFGILHELIEQINRQQRDAESPVAPASPTIQPLVVPTTRERVLQDLKARKPMRDPDTRFRFRNRTAAPARMLSFDWLLMLVILAVFCWFVLDRNNY